MNDLISRQDTDATITDILSGIQKVHNNIPDFCPSDWELHMSHDDLIRLCAVCDREVLVFGDAHRFCGLDIIVDDTAIKPILMPKTDWSLWNRSEES